MSLGEMTLLIRADATTQIGLGHVMRCLALGQAWQDRGGRVVFATTCQSGRLRKRLTREGFELVLLDKSYPNPADWEMTSQVLVENPDAWVVLDGYRLDSIYQCRIKKAGHRLLVIDDMAQLDYYYADVILNQNFHATKLHYRCAADTRLLLGTKYVLLRREFQKWRDWKREIPDVARNVLVTMGGSDPDNATLEVLRAIEDAELGDLAVVAVVGAENPHFESIQHTARASRHAVRLLEDAENMAELMAWANLAISSAGTTCWELAFMGVPAVLVSLVENQDSSAAALVDQGAALSIAKGDIRRADLVRILRQLLLSAKLRRGMSEAGRELVDGLGLLRAVSHLEGPRQLTLRSVEEDDAQAVLEWANDPDTREASFSSSRITMKEHLQWFEDKLSDPNVVMLLGTDCQGVTIGVVRFDLHEDEAVVSLNVAPEHRGRGHGGELLRLACREILSRPDVDLVIAHVKRENTRSVQVFLGAGFVVDGTECIQNHAAVCLVLHKRRWPVK